MDILEQCAKWRENGEYQKIIGALEAMPPEERAPEEDSERAGEMPWLRVRLLSFNERR